MTFPNRLLIFYVIIMLAGSIVSRVQRKPRLSLQSQSRAILKDWTASVAAISVAISLAFPVLEYILQDKPLIHPFSIAIGLALIIAGYCLAYVASDVIRGNWSPTIEKTQEQNLVTSGIYSSIRHPLYLSGLFIIVGTNTYFSGSWSWAGAALALLVILVRLPFEEQRLVKRFGQEYIDYRKRTKALLPWMY